MRQRFGSGSQAGQALVFALILLGIGALVVVPVLRLTSASVKNSYIITSRTKDFYAADAAQEFVMWKLLYNGYTSNFSYDGQSDNFTIDVCGSQVNVSVIMRAIPSRSEITLATDDKIRPSETVSPAAPPNRSFQTFTFIVRLEQLSGNNSQGLDAVYVILPQQFNDSYIAGSSYISTDSGPWQAIADPLVEHYPNQQDRLKWPAAYNVSTGAGGFTSPVRDFAVRQVKELKFQAQLNLPPSVDDTVKYNYAILKVGPLTTFSGPQAPIKIGAGTKQDREGMLTISKTANPGIIEPGIEQDVTYTIDVSNNDTSNHNIETITDYLPPEFFYLNGTTVGFGGANPTTSNVTINGVTRQRLVWTLDPSQKQINSGQTRTLTFIARTTKDASGSYYNEVLMDSDFVMPAVFSDIGLSQSDFQIAYSWNSGMVIVPAYDSQATSGNVTTIANLSMTSTGADITSYRVR